MPRQPCEPFQFSTALTLREATGLRAVSLSQLLKWLRVVDASVVYYHTHRYLLEHHYLTPKPPNDFGYWVTTALGEKALGEQLASVDTVQFDSLQALRQRLVEVIERHARDHPSIRPRISRIDEAFHFVKAVSVVLTTPYQAHDLETFAEGLQAVTIHSLYFHMYDARLRLQRGSNDFSLWFEHLGESDLARAVAALDLYTHTLEELRHTLLRLVRPRRSIESRT